MKVPIGFVASVYTRMPQGKYRTAAGSELEVKPNGGCTVWFDWFEEPDACVECRPDPMPDDEGYLVWSCDEHNGGKSKWLPS